MAISLYDSSVACFLQTLGGVEGFLSRGLAHCTERNIDPNEIRFQITSVAHHSLGAVRGAQQGSFAPQGQLPPLDYAALQKTITEARAALQQLVPADVNALEGKDVVFQVRDMKMPFKAEGFLLSFSLPNFHFHATTAYDILRSKGVPLGKRDYMGRLRLKE
jgi:hypothetical protein